MEEEKSGIGLISAGLRERIQLAFHGHEEQASVDALLDQAGRFTYASTESQTRSDTHITEAFWRRIDGVSRGLSNKLFLAAMNARNEGWQQARDEFKAQHCDTPVRDMFSSSLIQQEGKLVRLEDAANEAAKEGLSNPRETQLMELRGDVLREIKQFYAINGKNYTPGPSRG